MRRERPRRARDDARARRSRPARPGSRGDRTASRRSAPARSWRARTSCATRARSRCGRDRCRASPAARASVATRRARFPPPHRADPLPWSPRQPATSARRRRRGRGVGGALPLLGVRARFALGLVQRQARYRHTLLGERRNADHADVERPSGARGVALRMLGEEERRRLPHALAPAGDLDASVRLEHVARLLGRGGVAGDDVDAVHAGDRQHAIARAVADAHRVFVARHADDEAAAVLRVNRQRGPVVRS